MNQSQAKSFVKKFFMFFGIVIVSIILFAIVVANFSDSSKEVKYKIVKEEENYGSDRSTINIELEEKISEEQLAEIAAKLRKDRSFKRLWISYTIKGLGGIGAWATTHFSPELEVSILGPTKKHDAEIDSIKREHASFTNKWEYKTQNENSFYVLYRDQGTVRLVSYNRGIINLDQFVRNVVENTDDRGPRLDQIESSTGEYFIVDQNGDLAFYNEENRIFQSAKPIK